MIRRTAALLGALTAVLAPLVLAPLVLAVALAAPAQAHASLVSSSPEGGASVATVPAEVSLTFSQEVRAPAYVVLTSPSGDLADGDPVIDGDTVTQAVTPGPAGSYSLTFRVVSADGHPITGEVTFEVTEGDGSTPDSSAAADDPDVAGAGTSDPGTEESDAAATAPEEGWWTRHGDHVLIFGGLVVVAGGLLVVAMRRPA
ncbi:MAG TPA: copper resistance CopC family protein [Nocardioides sp.]